MAEVFRRADAAAGEHEAALACWPAEACAVSAIALAAAIALALQIKRSV